MQIPSLNRRWCCRDKKAHIKQWKSLRNALVHPKLGDLKQPNQATIQKQLDRIHGVQVLLCQITYYLIGYSGPYTDYAVEGFPIKEYRLAANDRPGEEHALTRDPWNDEQDRTDAQVWLWRAVSEIRVVRKFEPDLPVSGLDALEREVQGILDDLADDAKWAEYDNNTSRLVWHIQMIAACRAIQAMRTQFGTAFDRIQAITYESVWRAWNTGPVSYLEDTQEDHGAGNDVLE